MPPATFPPEPPPICASPLPCLQNPGVWGNAPAGTNPSPRPTVEHSESLRPQRPENTITIRIITQNHPISNRQNRTTSIRLATGHGAGDCGRQDGQDDGLQGRKDEGWCWHGSVVSCRIHGWSFCSMGGIVSGLMATAPSARVSTVWRRPRKPRCVTPSNAIPRGSAG